LLSVEGVAAVSREGGVDRQIRVILDPVALQAQGITAAQVNAQLRQTNLNAAGGRAEIAGSEQSVRVLGNARDAFDLSQTQIVVPGGRTVRLADLGEVKDAYSEQRTIAKMNGRQVISFNVQRSKGSSEVTVYDAAWEELRKIEKENPGVEFTQLFTSVDYTKDQYSSSMLAMVEAVPMVMQCPLERCMQDSAAVNSSCAILPARTSSDICHTPVPEPTILPRKWPDNIGPPEMPMVGMSQLAAPMISEGVVLSQPISNTTPSIGLPRIDSSTSMLARLRNNMAVGRSWVSPSDITGNSSGKPPAS
jgi:hypothetical protein